MTNAGVRGVYMGNDRILAQTNQGVRMFLDTRDIILTPIVLLNGEWEPETTRAFQRLLKPGMNVVDVGANVGYFACLIGHLIRPGGRLWAFEADPGTFEYLTDNINLNWFFDGVTLEQKAVYERAATLTLFSREKYKGNTSIGEVPTGDLDRIFDRQVRIDVQAIDLDSYFAGVDRSIDLVKIDVEGAEPFVLKGMEGLVAAHPGMRIMIEWSPGQIERAGAEPSFLLEWFRRHGFGKFLIADTFQPISDDELSGIGHGMVLLTRDGLPA